MFQSSQVRHHLPSGESTLLRQCFKDWHSSTQTLSSVRQASMLMRTTVFMGVAIQALMSLTTNG